MYMNSNVINSLLKKLDKTDKHILEMSNTRDKNYRHKLLVFQMAVMKKYATNKLINKYKK
jgi:hypothetical protein